MNKHFSFRKTEPTFDPTHIWIRGVVITLVVVTLLLCCGGILYYFSLHTDFFGTIPTEEVPQEIDKQSLIEVTNQLREREAALEEGGGSVSDTSPAEETPPDSVNTSESAELLI